MRAAAPGAARRRAPRRATSSTGGGAAADGGGAAVDGGGVGRWARRCWRALREAALPARRAIGTSVIRSRNGRPRPGGRPRGRYDTADFMADLNAWLLDNLALAFGVLAALVLLLLIGFLVQSARLGRAVRDYRELVRGTDGSTLHDRLVGSAEQAVKASERMGQIEAMQALVEGRTQRSLQHIGLVRFNPFDDTGSDQSFAIALLDDARDGVVISSLHGRANTRVFAKPVTNGELGAQPVRRGEPGDPDRDRGVAVGVDDRGDRPRAAARRRAARPRRASEVPSRAAAVGRPAGGLAGLARPRRRWSEATAPAPGIRAADPGGRGASSGDRGDGR